MIADHESRRPAKKGASYVFSGRCLKGAGRRLSAEYQLPVHGSRAHGAGKLHGVLSGVEVRIVGSYAGAARLSRLGGAGRGLDPDQVKGERYFEWVEDSGGGWSTTIGGAAQVSKAVQGRLKVIWTREEICGFRLTGRRACISERRGGWSGMAVAFTHRIVAPSISGQKDSRDRNGIDPDLADEAAWFTHCPNVSLEYVLAKRRCRWAGCVVYALQALLRARVLSMNWPRQREKIRWSTGLHMAEQR